MLKRIQDILKKQYGLSGTLTSLPGELDLNFTLQTSSEKYIVKLMRPSCEEAFIDFQCQALVHLEGRCDKIQLPEVIPAKDQSLYIKLDIEGSKRILWILTFCEGKLWAKLNQHDESLAYSFGKAISVMTTGFTGFEHTYMEQQHPWMLTESAQSYELAQYVEGKSALIVKQVFEDFQKRILPKLSDLPHQIIHNDANDYNVVVQIDDAQSKFVSGVFDFGDMAYQPIICELAIALSYAMMKQEHPLRMAYHFLKGYDSQRDLTIEELEVLFALIKTRLAVSISISSHRQIQNPDDPYITVSQQPAKALLEKLDQIPEALALCFFRKACNYPALEKMDDILDFIKMNPAQPIMSVDNHTPFIDLSVGSLLLGADPEHYKFEKLNQIVQDFMEQSKKKTILGRYLEARRLYAAEGFGRVGHPAGEARNIHLGLDIFAKSGKEVCAPYDGKVVFNTYIDKALDYGGLLILEHQTSQGNSFYTLYGHLAPDSLQNAVGASIKAGQVIARLGKPDENGGWPPHLHLQIILDLVGLDLDYPGVAYDSESEIWKSLSPNPALLFPVLDAKELDASISHNDLLERRKRSLGYNLSLSYKEPLHIVAGFKQFLYDNKANCYLDFYNNVPHVGHQHPRVVEAIKKQAALLNTNTRYLHENILNYAERLCAKLPDNLSVCYFTNSATEANELAIRMARAYTKRYDMMVVDDAYHGHTTTLINISPYKHNGPGGAGAPEWVHSVPIADGYRGGLKGDKEEAGLRYAEEVAQKVNAIEKQGRKIAAFIAETYPSVGGQIIPPPGYLKKVYEIIHQHGGICIADEVQTGFGRLGKSFWAFESQGVQPDMIVLGKPIGNGFPLAVVVTKPEIAKAFDNGMEYFSTFGGNPVSCAAGLAVLEEIENSDLQKNAEQMGELILNGLRALKNQYPIIGDVRGEGLFLGVELVEDHTTLSPATKATSYVVNQLKKYHILAGIDGPLHNVIKLRPPLCINKEDVGYFLDCFELIISDWR